MTKEQIYSLDEFADAIIPLAQAYLKERREALEAFRRGEAREPFMKEAAEMSEAGIRLDDFLAQFYRVYFEVEIP